MVQLRPPLFRSSSSFVMAGFLLVLLLLSGGSARADVPGQVIARAGAWIAILFHVLAQDRSTIAKPRAVFWLLTAALLLICVQLTPLPPAIWQALPGREMFGAASRAVPPPWRPIAIVPGAAFNAASSLVVPFAVLFAVSSIKEREHRWLLVLVFGLMVVSMLIGLVQFSGADLHNPLLNGDPGQVSGLFANRNHFALFLAMGCVIAPFWGFPADRPLGWRIPVSLGLLVLFLLVIIASGSRAGLLLGGIGVIAGGLLAWQRTRHRLRGYPRWALPAGGVLLLVLIAVFVAASLVAGRAVSIDRLFAMDQAEDMRARALPTVLAMVRMYFPIGSGFGSFDPVFRMHEPFGLLKTTYFNHAHDDFLEIVLDGGAPAALLLAIALWWWGHATVRALRSARSSSGGVSPLLGSALLLLLLVASVFDYPARTPMMMAMIVIAAIWLQGDSKLSSRSALPASDQQL